jgi:quercetin dioxygenase-like cupin family protein
MDTTAFEASLKADGYNEIETKRYEPRPANGEHDHHFSVRGLILEGAFTVTLEGNERTYRPGEVFEVDAERLHFEEVPSEGVKLIVGRKY